MIRILRYNLYDWAAVKWLCFPDVLLTASTIKLLARQILNVLHLCASL